MPLIHDSKLTPFSPTEVIQIGGVYVTQMTAQMAKANYPEYLKPPLNNKPVGVVIKVDANSSDWHILRIVPGFLLTKVNNKELEHSISESLQDAEYLTFEGNGKKIVKMLV